MAFNRVVRVWCHSFANDELEAHKRWSIEHNAAIFDRPEAVYIPQQVRERPLTSEPIENLQLAPRSPWTNPEMSDRVKADEAKVVMNFSNSGPLEVSASVEMTFNLGSKQPKSG